MSFAAVDPAFGVAAVEDSQRVTWLLLHFHDHVTGEIRLELSCPDEMNGRQVTGWREQIILEAVPFSTELEIDINIEDDDDGDIDVDVSRRPS